MNFIELWQVANISSLVEHEIINLFIKFLLNVSITLLIVLYIYKPMRKDNSYLFTYIIFNILIFFLCHLMLNVKLSIGFAFGLFALFSIMRYRTTTINIKDMTYLFAVVCIAVINALSNSDVSYLELGIINGTIVGSIFILESFLFTELLYSCSIQYDDIDLIHHKNQFKLFEDLKDRTGKNIEKIEIESINYINDSALLHIYFKESPIIKTQNLIINNPMETQLEKREKKNGVFSHNTINQSSH